ncbi:NAD(P)-binding protein [Atractiella rhizophila]|nr:NAD(P)-binding protein [Atractiella rhizophila]
MSEVDLFPPSPTWKVEELPRQDGRVIIVTGGYSGIGEETSRVLLLKGAKVYIAGRSKKKAEEAIVRLLDKTEVEKDKLCFHSLDLGSIKAARESAFAFLKLEQRLDVLINNAGIMTPPNGSRTSDGYEMQFGTNVLGHFAFTIPLLPLLEATVPLNKPGAVRIIQLSSAGNLFAPPEGLTFDHDKKVGTNNKGLFPPTRHRDYGQSKLGNILITQRLAKLYPSILSLSAHPGAIQSDLLRNENFFWRQVSRLFLQPIEKGGWTPLYAALSTDIDHKRDNGGYVRPFGRLDSQNPPSRLHPKATDEDLEKMLWEFCERECAKY